MRVNRRIQDRASVNGVYAPCTFHKLPPCSLLLLIFCPLLLFHPFPRSFFLFLCSLLNFNFFSCSFLEFSSAQSSFLPFLVLLALGLWFVCYLLLSNCLFSYLLLVALPVQYGFLPAPGLPLTGVQDTHGPAWCNILISRMLVWSMRTFFNFFVCPPAIAPKLWSCDYYER